MQDHTTDGFVAVNPDWIYSVRLPTGRIIHFTPQADGLWLAKAGKPGGFLVTPEQAVKVLNESLGKGLRVSAVNTITGKALLLERRETATPARTPAQAARTN